MPKRKYIEDDDKLEYLSWKVAKLQRKLNRRSRSKSKERNRSRKRSKRSRTRHRSPSTGRDSAGAVHELLGSPDRSIPSDEAEDELNPSDACEGVPLDNGQDTGLNTNPLEVAVAEAPNENANSNDVAAVDNELENELLDILGVNPSSTVEYGDDIHSELASRLQHIATCGLTKEARKELNAKYPIPANCVKFGAPSMNLEIKAAVTETVTKRDKGIEARQKQLASAISGLANLLNKELGSKEKDATRSKQLMDVCRILCDIQHAESVTRRNFAIYSIKRELKEHLVNTKIDKCLFGENLAETLKSAKAVSKSGSEMKTKPPPKPKPLTSSASNLNWRSPAPARRQQGVPRGRGPPPPATGAGPDDAIVSQHDARHLVEAVAVSAEENSPQLSPPSEHTNEPYPGCRSVVRTALLRRSIPPSAVDIMMASLSKNSYKQYDVALRRWFAFSVKNNVNLYQASIPTVLYFLTEAFNRGCQYGTMNSYRSALTLILGPYMANDDRISRFFEGIYRLRPPKPKYNITWDTALVLDYLELQIPNESLTLEKLTKKCVALLALATAHRVQTLSKININNIEIFDKKIVIKIPDRIKTSRPGFKQPVLTLPFFTERPGICPSTTLISYLEKTKSLRGNNTSLFVSFRKPHSTVSAQSISRWIKSVLKDSGIDVSIFTAHSTRHAATSRAHQCGVSVDLIRNTAGWSGSSNTFGKFYNKTIMSNNEASALATAVLSDT